LAGARLDLSEIYDAIIVGAGPAGCVLASRLSEQSQEKIVLIEAGPDVAAPGAEDPDVLDPFAPAASNNPAFRWPGLVAEIGADPGDRSARVTGPYLQGYGVGGASNINGMGVDRGQPADYNKWRDLGAKGWGWDDVLPYFRKLEHDLDFSGPSALSMHGNIGPMPVRRLPRPRWAPFAAAIGDALERRGYPFIEDYAGEFREGFSGAPTNSLPDRRVSASMAYLTREVRCRANLTILANVRVDRLSLEDRRANGVFVNIAETRRLVRGRQIIVSCGAIQSPALLMRSGIGPGEQLTRQGIEVLHDAPGVGANLQNHPCVTVAMYLPREAIQDSDNPAFLQNWLRFSSNYPGCDHNDMHLMPFNKCDWHDLGGRVGAVAVSVLESYSKGCVELSSADPSVSPKVRFNLLSDPRDRERLVSGLRFVLEVLTDPHVVRMRREIFVPNGRLVANLSRRNGWNRIKAWAIAMVLDCAPLRRMLLAASRIDPEKLLADEEALREFVRLRAQLQYHVCGTCRMGHAGDADAVVDSAGRVHGMEALRVVDASIFPTIPRGYTHFVVLMAAEKVADAIKSEWHSSVRGPSP
jgi:5-(hydroxymethyl)furfural/furfural oxidase